MQLPDRRDLRRVGRSGDLLAAPASSATDRCPVGTTPSPIAPASPGRTKPDGRIPRPLAVPSIRNRVPVPATGKSQWRAMQAAGRTTRPRPAATTGFQVDRALQRLAGMGPHASAGRSNGRVPRVGTSAPVGNAPRSRAGRRHALRIRLETPGRRHKAPDGRTGGGRPHRKDTFAFVGRRLVSWSPSRSGGGAARRPSRPPGGQPSKLPGAHRGSRAGHGTPAPSPYVRESGAPYAAPGRRLTRAATPARASR